MRMQKLMKQGRVLKLPVRSWTHEGNVFEIVSRVCKLLKQANREEDAHTLFFDVMGSSSYNESLDIIRQYIDINFIKQN